MLRETILSSGSGLGMREGFTFERLSAGKNAVRHTQRVRKPSRSFVRCRLFDVFNENTEPAFMNEGGAFATMQLNLRLVGIT